MYGSQRVWFTGVLERFNGARALVRFQETGETGMANFIYCCWWCYYCWYKLLALLTLIGLLDWGAGMECDTA